MGVGCCVSVCRLSWVGCSAVFLRTMWAFLFVHNPNRPLRSDVRARDSHKA
jgi:hypothetical protein